MMAKAEKEHDTAMNIAHHGFKLRQDTKYLYLGSIR